MKRTFITLFLIFSISRIAYPQEVLVGDDYKNESSVLNEELRKLNIEEQLKKLDALDLRLKKIENLATPTVDTDAATKAYVDSYVATYVAAHSSTSVSIGTLAIGTTGSKAITGLGFQPTFIFFIWGPTTEGSGESSGIGFMTATTARSVYDFSASANWASGVYSGNIVSSGGADEFSIEYVSMDSDGFTVNVSDAGTATTMYYIAIK